LQYERAIVVVESNRPGYSWVVSFKVDKEIEIESVKKIGTPHQKSEESNQKKIQNQNPQHWLTDKED